MGTEVLKNLLMQESGLPDQAFDIEENRVLLHINMCDIPLPEGDCDNFVYFFEPLIASCIENGVHFGSTQLVFNHPFESNMLLINNDWWFNEAHKIAKQYNISAENVTVITGNWKVFWLYQKWHRASNFAREPMFNLEAHMQMLWCYAPNIYNGDSIGEGDVFDSWGMNMEFDYCNPRR